MKIFKIAKGILERMVFYQVEQGNERNEEVFLTDPVSNKASGGFNWEDSVEGVSFWNAITRMIMFPNEFLPECAQQRNYTLLDLIVRYTNNQVAVGNIGNISDVVNEIAAMSDNKGFDWGMSVEGREFWEKATEILRNELNKTYIID